MSSDVLESARKVAMRYLETTARSRAEIERRLERGGFSEDIIAAVVAEIEARGWLNDTEFARAWVEDRADRKQYGKTRLTLELRRKGIASDTIDESLAGVSQEDRLARAMGAVTKKIDPESFQTMSGTDLQAEKRRLSGFLLRRGFSWSTVKQVFQRLMVNEEEF